MEVPNRRSPAPTPWYRVLITEACVLGGAYHRLCRQFQRAFIAAGAPLGMALFAQTLPLGDTREVYVTPEGATHLRDMIEEYGGCPCAPPSQDGLTMVFGVPEAAGHLFRSSAPVVSPGLPLPRSSWSQAAVG